MLTPVCKRFWTCLPLTWLLSRMRIQTYNSSMDFWTSMDHDVRPPWDVVREESTEVKILWTQFHRLKIQEKFLYRRRKETAANPQWQVVASKPLRSQIFKACQHHAMAAHQGVVRTAALIKRRIYWPIVQKDIEAWCKRCTACRCCKITGEHQQRRHGAFNKRVSVDLIGPLSTGQNVGMSILP